ncbi:hypothetical protein TSOC_006311 [Tetrabaena socialis]|uniref:Serine aminopeptidase S33 domain-containing protein n=1 Tax=Tetrabaena socialis TaxID=47790 RepID=A0A2J8A3Z6_9CHLO|nr:hypothetical protein TSOC_006311 [Tetrabaena socialis]|eukprot:PNH07227.1 hypothetical protein TSOC_006311 [Tetrabaena socialis]
MAGIAGTPGTFLNARAQRLHTLAYRPARLPASALLFVHHGLGEHCGRYDKAAGPRRRVQAMMGGLMAALVPRARLVPAVRPQDMSQDPQVVADYISDPLNTVGPVRARTGNEMLRGFHAINAAASQLTLPVFVAHGTRDACTNAAASRRFVEGPGGVSSEDRVFRSVEGGFHELLHGPEWEACTRELLAWMRARGAGAEAGPEAGVGAEAGGVEGGMEAGAPEQSRL